MKLVVATILLVLNIVSFCLMAYDKRCAQKRKWRVPEKVLFLLTGIFGGFGGILGILLCRHKTQSRYFRLPFPLMLVIQAVLGYLYVIL